MVPPAKIRRRNYGEDEMLQLLAEVEKRKDVILAPVAIASRPSNITNSMRDKAWESVTAAINSHLRTDCQMIRSSKELRKKFRDFKADVKKKATVKAYRGAEYGEVEKAMLLLLASSPDTSQSSLDSDISKSIHTRTYLQQGKGVYKSPHHFFTAKQADGIGRRAEARLVGALDSSSAPEGGFSRVTEDPLSCTSTSLKDSIIVISDNVEQIIPITQYHGDNGSITSSDPVMVNPLAAPPVTTPLAGNEKDTTSRLSAPLNTNQSIGGEVRQVSMAPPSPPSCCPPSHGSSRPGTPPPGPGIEARLMSDVVQTQREIRDLLSELVQQQREAVMAQREAVLAQREAVMAQRESIVTAKEGIAVLQAVVEDHRQSTSAMVTLAKVVGNLYKSSTS